MKCIRIWLCSEERHKAIKAGAEPLPEEFHEVPLKDFAELTVAEYARIMDEPEGELPHELIARVFGIPDHLAMAMKLHERNSMITFYNAWMRDSASMWARSKQLYERLAAIPEEQEGKPWDAKQARAALEDVQMFRTSFEVDGKTYIVPEFLEEQTVLAQWIDAKILIEQHQKAGLPEWKLYPKMLSVFCMEAGDRWPMRREDEAKADFAVRFNEWFAPRPAIFEHARMVDAMCVNAFFFSSSSEFRAITLRSMTSFLSLLSPLNVLMRTPTGSGGDQRHST